MWEEVVGELAVAGPELPGRLVLPWMSLQIHVPLVVLLAPPFTLSGGDGVVRSGLHLHVVRTALREEGMMTQAPHPDISPQPLVLVVDDFQDNREMYAEYLS